MTMFQKGEIKNMSKKNYVNYDVEEQLESDSLWLVKWNDFLCCLKRTIKDDEPIVALSKKEDLEAIE